MTKARTHNNLDAQQELEVEQEFREDGRLADERAERQDLNQGMDTGTHESTRYGVHWGPSYRTTKKQIEARAYELYLQRGGEHGQHLEDWLLAEKELKQENANEDSAPPKTRAAANSGSGDSGKDIPRSTSR